MYVTTWMKLKNTILHEKSDIKNHGVHDFICKKHNQTNPQKQKADQKLPRARRGNYEQEVSFMEMKTFWN